MKLIDELKILDAIQKQPTKISVLSSNSMNT